MKQVINCNLIKSRSFATMVPVAFVWSSCVKKPDCPEETVRPSFTVFIYSIKPLSNCNFSYFFFSLTFSINIEQSELQANDI